MKKRLFSLLLVLVMALSLLPTQAYAYLGGLSDPTGRLMSKAAPATIKKEGVDDGSQIYSFKMNNGKLVFFLAVDGPHAGKSVTTSDRGYTPMMDSVRAGVYEQARFTLQTDSSQKSLKLEKMEVVDPRDPQYLGIADDNLVPSSNSLVVRCHFSGYGESDPQPLCYITYYFVELGPGKTRGLASSAQDAPDGKTFALVAQASWGLGMALDNSPEYSLRYFQDYHGFSRMGHAKAAAAAHVKLSQSRRGASAIIRSTDITAGLGRTRLDDSSGSRVITEVFSDSYGVDNPFVLADHDLIRTINDIPPTLYMTYDAAADRLITEGYTRTLGGGDYGSGTLSTLHAWGFRAVSTKAEAEAGGGGEGGSSDPDKVTVPQNADRLGLYRTPGGVLAAPILGSTQEAVLKAIYGAPLYTLRGSFEMKTDESGTFYEFTEKKAALTPTITAAWSSGHFRVRLNESGLFSGFDATPSVQYSTPRFMLFSAANPTGPAAGLAFDGNILTLNMNPEDNAVLVFIDIPQVTSKIDKAQLKPNGDLILSGEMGLDLILNSSPDKLLELEALGYGPSGSDFKQNGIKASGKLDTGSLLGLELAEIEAEINTFKGQELYKFSLELNAFDLFETEAELELKRLKNGRLAPNNLYFSLAVEPGIPLVPPVPTAFLKGGGGGFYGLADTINGDHTGIPPISLKLTAIGDYLKVIEGEVHITLGPSYLEYSGTNMKIAKVDILDSFNVYLRLVGEKRSYRGTNYTGLRAGGGMGIKLKAPKGDKAIFEVNSKVEASMFGGLDNYSRPTSAYLQIDSRGGVNARVMIPKQLGKLKFRVIGGKTLASASADFILGAQTAVNVNPNAYAGLNAGQILSKAATSAWNNLSVYGGLSHKGNFALTHWRLYYILPDHVGGAFHLVKNINKNWSLQDEINKNAWFVSGNRAQAFSAAPFMEDTYLCIDDETGEQIGIAVVECSLFALPAAEDEGISLFATQGSDGRYSETITNTPAHAGADQLLLQIFPKNAADWDTLRASLSITPDGQEAIKLVEPSINSEDEFTNPDKANCTEIEDELEDGTVRTGLLIATGLGANIEQTLTIAADCDFDYVLCANARPTTLDFSLSGYNASSSIVNPRDGRTYAVRYYLDTQPDRTGENYFLDMVEESGSYGFTVLSEGSLAPSGEYYVTAVLVEEVTGDFNGDGTTAPDERSWVTVDTATSTAKISYTNNTIPNAPGSVTLDATGNETLTASWAAPTGTPAVDGYRVTLYYNDRGDWKQAGAPYVLDNADFDADSKNPAATTLADGKLSLRMAPTVGGKEVEVGGSPENPTVISTGSTPDKSPADTNYKVAVESFRYEEETEKSVYYFSDATESGTTMLPAYTAPTLTVTYGENNSTVTLNSSNGYDMLTWKAIPDGTLFTVSGVDGSLAVEADPADPGSGIFTVAGDGSTGFTVTADNEGKKLIENSGRVKLTVKKDRDVTDYYLRLTLDDVAPVLTLDSENVYADMTTGEYSVTGVTEPGLLVSMGAGNSPAIKTTADPQGRFALSGMLSKDDPDSPDLFRSLLTEVTTQDGVGNDAEPAPVLISARPAAEAEQPPAPPTPPVTPGNPSDSGGSSSGGSSSSDRDDSGPRYAVDTLDKSENGSVSVNPKNASKGDRVTVTVKPDEGYELDTLTVTDSKGSQLELTDKGDGKFTFIMPAGKVEIAALFRPVGPAFSDVFPSAWYNDAVAWAVANGITMGIGGGLFGPNEPCTRAQIVTFLWRAAGSPEPKGTAGMSDVNENSFYAKAVAWAIENGITTGVGGGRFSPDNTCTRAQAVTFLARALGAKAEGRPEFSDVPANAWYAEAVAWAAANGITTGIGGGLFGSGDDCARAQIVTFLFRAFSR